jgi:hypothetical protein
MKKATLLAFEIEDQRGFYNVWRYDTPSTICVLFAYKANSEESAVSAAKARLTL